MKSFSQCKQIIYKKKFNTLISSSNTLSFYHNIKFPAHTNHKPPKKTHHRAGFSIFPARVRRTRYGNICVRGYIDFPPVCSPRATASTGLGASSWPLILIRLIRRKLFSPPLPPSSYTIVRRLPFACRSRPRCGSFFLGVE